MLEYIPTRQVHQRLSEGWEMVSREPGDYAALMQAPEGWEPPRLDDTKPFRTCSIQNCDSKHYAHGYCDKHHKRVLRLGTPTLPCKVKYECSEAGCHKQRRSRGLCEMHLSRVRRKEKSANKSNGAKSASVTREAKRWAFVDRKLAEAAL
jgi:hypothetical protein